MDKQLIRIQHSDSGLTPKFTLLPPRPAALIYLSERLATELPLRISTYCLHPLCLATCIPLGCHTPEPKNQTLERAAEAGDRTQGKGFKQTGCQRSWRAWAGGFPRSGSSPLPPPPDAPKNTGTKWPHEQSVNPFSPQKHSLKYLGFLDTAHLKAPFCLLVFKRSLPECTL